jgi:hypothetical protein
MFTFATVPPGNYLIRADHTGFITKFYGDGGRDSGGDVITVAAGQDLGKKDIGLIPAGVISGTVFDDQGDPIEGMTVSAIHLQYSPGGQERENPVRTATTDDLGNFRLFGLTPGNYFVRTGVVNQGISIGNIAESRLSYRMTYYPGTASVEGAQRIRVAPGSEASGVRFSVGFQSTYTIRGTIVDPSSGPGQRRYAITIGRAGTNQAGAIVAGGSATNADGSFVLSGISSGDYIVTARAIQTNIVVVPSGPNSTSASVNAQPRTDAGYAGVRVTDADARVSIQIGRSSEVRGKVVIENSRSQSPSGYTILLQPQSQAIVSAGNSSNTYSATFDSIGSFDIQNIEPGSYSISVIGKGDLYLMRAVCGGRDYTFQPLVVEPNSSLGECTLTLANDPGTISGQVLDGDKPIADSVVVAIPQTPSLRQIPRYSKTARTDVNGQFKIVGLVPGDYFLFAVAPDDEQSYYAVDFAERHQRDIERVSVQAGESKTINLKPTTPQ